MKMLERPNMIRSAAGSDAGFTIPEVIIAGVILVVLCIGVFEAFVFAIRYNRGNNLRMQALSVLQQEVEHYRSLKFIPVGSDAELNGGTYSNVRTRTSADGRVFNISVIIDNNPSDNNPPVAPEPDTANESTTTLKQITITAAPVVAETEGWLQNLNTKVTVQRVKSN
jgi:type II secretory pathway pseudopilin PulG